LYKKDAIFHVNSGLEDNRSKGDMSLVWSILSENSRNDLEIAKSHLGKPQMAICGQNWSPGRVKLTSGSGLGVLGMVFGVPGGVLGSRGGQFGCYLHSITF